MFDLGPATTEMTRLISGVREEDLRRPTPCDEWTVAELLAHIHQFTTVFADNARKNPVQPPDSLVDDWRTAIPTALDDLALGWRDASAWEGRVSAGGVEMPAEDNAIVAVEELTMHAWDLARATDQAAQVDESTLDRVEKFFVMFSPDADAGQGPFGPMAAVPADADRLDRVVAKSGRDPRWS